MDFEAKPEWDDHEEWARYEQPVRLGSVIRLKTRGAPAASVRVTEYQPDRRFVTEGKVPLAVLRFVFELEPKGPSTLVVYRQEMIGPLSGLWARLFGSRMVSDAPVTLKRLERRASELGT